MDSSALVSCKHMIRNGFLSILCLTADSREPWSMPSSLECRAIGHILRVILYGNTNTTAFTYTTFSNSNVFPTVTLCDPLHTVLITNQWSQEQSRHLKKWGKGQHELPSERSEPRQTELYCVWLFQTHRHAQKNMWRTPSLTHSGNRDFKSSSLTQGEASVGLWMPFHVKNRPSTTGCYFGHC